MIFYEFIKINCVFSQFIREIKQKKYYPLPYAIFSYKQYYFDLTYNQGWNFITSEIWYILLPLNPIKAEQNQHFHLTISIDLNLYH